MDVSPRTAALVAKAIAAVKRELGDEAPDLGELEKFARPDESGTSAADKARAHAEKWDKFEKRGPSKFPPESDPEEDDDEEKAPRSFDDARAEFMKRVKKARKEPVE
jgi:hypothetical protein